MKINRNFFWTTLFVHELASLGLQHVCISPGSRSTPLVTAFAKSESIEKHIIIDERSAAFFALGLAKSTNAPVALVCTSGTAVAEYYPAIIEAYQTRVPLIVCTADRPPELRNCGANQTINQDNIYRNHIRWFIDTGLPDISEAKQNHIKAIARKAFTLSLIHRRGPVHINFPFRKPLESHIFTDEIEDTLYDASTESQNNKIFFYKEENSDKNSFAIDKIEQFIKKKQNGIIIIGGMQKNDDFLKHCATLAKVNKYPVFADIQSNGRFFEEIKDVCVENYDVIMRYKPFISKNKPDFILQFGRTPISKGLEDWLSLTDAPRYVINEFGDCFDPQKNAQAIIEADPAEFCKNLLKKSTKKQNTEQSWLNAFLYANLVAEEKKAIFRKENIDIEPNVMLSIMDYLPEESALMVSNSTPIRDFDFFASKKNADIAFYASRGASGIDGIVSTAYGVAVGSKRRTFLVTGDLAFLHDISALLHYKYLKCNLTIIVLNNSGGGIFEFLPIAEEEDVFEKYFLTPQNHNFAEILHGFGISYTLIETKEALEAEMLNDAEGIRVLEVKTDAKRSLKVRNTYRKAVHNQL